MLVELRVRNLAVVEEIVLEPGPGLNVISGETGAGKSILVLAIELLFGGRADADTIRTGAEVARIEGLFQFEDADFFRRRGIDQDIPDRQLLLVRELQKNGRTRALVNDQMATIGRLKILGEAMADLHGQHEHQRLLRPESHVDYLDRYGLIPGADGRKGIVSTGALSPVEAWRLARERWQVAVRSLAALDARGGTATERRAAMNAELADIESASLVPGEEVTLKADRQRLIHIEKLMSAVSLSLDSLDEGDMAIDDRLAEITRRLTQASALDPALSSIVDGMKRALVELTEAGSELRHYRDDLPSEPDRAARIEERLALIGRLRKLHDTDEAGLLERAAALRLSIDALADETRARAALAVERERAAADLSIAGLDLRRWRQGVAERFARGVGHELASLGMKGACLSVRITPLESPDGIEVEGRHLDPGSAGFDEIEFDLAANPGEEPRPLGKVASGGELSRVMLALKAILRAVDPLPILLFDEVDAGIGGRVATEVGRRLKEISTGRQVLVITHLPMIAAPADHHFRVTKEMRKGRTVTLVARLDPAEREEELARMMVGAETPDEARRTARALLDSARREAR
ncbi:MAG: DNA repair protein RecN [Candidatus Eisenbacteria bacterium]|nr:DNA repair protein RecN [Candidatus Eisenbacteria bacterium]